MLKPELLKRDLGHVLCKLEELQEERIKAEAAPKKDRARHRGGGPRGGACVSCAIRISSSESSASYAACAASWARRRATCCWATWRPCRRKLDRPLDDHRPVGERGGKDDAHGGCPRVLAAGGADQVLGHDGPGALLHGGHQFEAQDPRHRGGGGSGEGELRAQAPAVARASSRSPRRARTRTRAGWRRRNTASRGRS